VTALEVPAVLPTSITLQVVGVPASQGSKTRMPNGAMVEGSTAKARAALKSWRTAVADAARLFLAENPRPPIAEPVMLIQEFRFPPVASDPYRTFVATTPDASKIQRSTEDALVHGGLLADDRFIVSWSGVMRYAAEGEAVGVTLSLELLGEMERKRRDERKASAAEARKLARRAS
jgi:Holliday junction resolvase RusA-like endonuclease